MKFVIAVIVIAILTVIFYRNTPVVDNTLELTKTPTIVLSNTNTTLSPKPVSPASTALLSESVTSNSSNTIEEASHVTEQQSLLEKYLDGEILFERVDNGDLFDYLLTLWDGQSSIITDPIYDITVIQTDEHGVPTTIDVMRKTTQEEIDDFRLSHTPEVIDEFRASQEFGEYNPELEETIRDIADNLNDGLVTFDALSCKELKCVLYAEGNSEQSFDAFTDGLSKLDDYFLTIMHPGDPKQALIYVIKKQTH